MKFFRIALLDGAYGAGRAGARCCASATAAAANCATARKAAAARLSGLRDTNAGTVSGISGFRDAGFVRHGGVRFGCSRVGFNGAIPGCFAQGAGDNRRFQPDGNVSARLRARSRSVSIRYICTRGSYEICNHTDASLAVVCRRCDSDILHSLPTR